MDKAPAIDPVYPKPHPSFNLSTRSELTLMMQEPLTDRRLGSVVDWVGLIRYYGTKEGDVDYSGTLCRILYPIKNNTKESLQTCTSTTVTPLKLRMTVGPRAISWGEIR